MKLAFFAVGLFAFTVVSAQARLGEGMSQLAARYGDPLPKPDQKPPSGLDIETFEKNGFQVEVTLIQGVSARESFKKLNGDIFATTEVQTLLADNAQGFSWQAPQPGADRTSWQRDDGTQATLTENRVLKITSGTLLNAEANERQLERTPSLDGF